MCHRAGDSSRGALCLYLSGQWGADTLAHTNSHTGSLKHTHSKHLYKGRAPARLFLERLSGIANILENNNNSSVNNCLSHVKLSRGRFFKHLQGELDSPRGQQRTEVAPGEVDRQ